MLLTLFIVLAFSISIYFYLQQPEFGKAVGHKKLLEFKNLQNFKNGKFQNINHTPDLTEGYSMLGVMYDFLFGKHTRLKPEGTIPTVKTDLLKLPANKNLLVWFGHSSYFMQIDGKTFLVDPVFSGNASPLPGTNKSFKGTDQYSADDVPPVDYLIITHDHWDHLDYKTVKGLKNKVGKILCGLGVGAHLEHWGFMHKNIIEKNWHEKAELESGFVAHCEPARHFSGRGFSRNKTLWVSFLLQTPSMKIYIGGDSGYDHHFSDIGKKYGSIDLAILDNGQYNKAWQLIHAMPEEVLKAAKDLNAKRLLPVHSSKFKMANHAWDAPLVKISELNKSANISIITPMIGEVVYLDDVNQQFKEWWAGII